MPRNSGVVQRLRSGEGQALVLVALLLTSLVGFIGLVVDVAWFQLNLVKVQRAADAGALAGSVFLPGNVPGAVAAAKQATAQNGFADTIGGVTISAGQDPVNTQMLNVTVNAPVGTWFMRVFGVTQISSSRNARAEFILPVPMGSPQNYYGIARLCTNSSDPPGTPPVPCGAVPDATGVGTLATQGFWGAVITKGGNRGNGDLYSTYYNGVSGGNRVLNTQYDANGYSYQIDFPVGSTNGSVHLFDPTFCATGVGNGSNALNGQQLGTGDHWINASGNPAPNNGGPVTTEFKLWDMNGTPFSTTDDILIATPGSLFSNQKQADFSTAYGGDGNFGGGVNRSTGGLGDCQGDTTYHNVWWLMKSGLAAGSYRLQVITSSSNNDTISAENMFGIEATATGGTPHVFGQARMCTYNNVPKNTNQEFYLAQIQAVHAGKTLELKVHDLGDVTGNAVIKIKMPDTADYVLAPFRYSINGGTFQPAGSGTVTQLQVANNGGLYDNQLIVIQIVIPTTYTAPQPATETLGAGWWKVRYELTGDPGGGNDTATWSVNIRGNPVHLVTP
jgi:Flp pilus assembly protein TadG